jgi:hypothetical protein
MGEKDLNSFLTEKWTNLIEWLENENKKLENRNTSLECSIENFKILKENVFASIYFIHSFLLKFYNPENKTWDSAGFEQETQKQKQKILSNLSSLPNSEKVFKDLEKEELPDNVKERIYLYFSMFCEVLTDMPIYQIAP